MTYQGMIAETITITGQNGDEIEAYYSRPLGAGPVPGVVVIHHIYGMDEWSREVTRKLAYHGFAAICPNLYTRYGEGTPDDQGARARADGGVADAQVIADVDGAARYMKNQPYSNGKVGVIGFCSGGRQTYLVACNLQIDAAVNCWGGAVVVDDLSTLTDKRPTPVIDMSANLSAPMLGLFGNDDMNPSPAHVDKIEETLKANGKDFEHHRYDGAGHGFFAVDRPNYRAEQATDGWTKVLAFFEKNLR